MSEQFTWPFDLDLGFDSYPTLSESETVVPPSTDFDFFPAPPGLEAYKPEDPTTPKPQPTADFSSLGGFSMGDTSVWSQNTDIWWPALGFGSQSGIGSSASMPADVSSFAQDPTSSLFSLGFASPSGFGASNAPWPSQVPTSWPAGGSLGFASPSASGSSNASTPELVPSPQAGPSTFDIAAELLQLFPSLSLASSSRSAPAPSRSRATARANKKRTRAAKTPYTKPPTKTPRQRRRHTRATLSLRPDFTEEYIPGRPNGTGNQRRVLGEGQVYVHKIDWDNHPPFWGDKPIPRMPVDELISYLTDKFNIAEATRCMLDGCTAEYNPGGLRSHILSQDHFHLRTLCNPCGYAARPDWFAKRHVCTAH